MIVCRCIDRRKHETQAITSKETRQRTFDNGEVDGELREIPGTRAVDVGDRHHEGVNVCGLENGGQRNGDQLLGSGRDRFAGGGRYRSHR